MALWTLALLRDGSKIKVELNPTIGKSVVCDFEECFHSILVLDDLIVRKHVAPDSYIWGCHNCCGAHWVGCHSWGDHGLQGALHMPNGPTSADGEIATVQEECCVFEKQL